MCLCMYVCVCVCACIHVSMCVCVIVQLVGDIVSCKGPVANRNLCKVKHVFTLTVYLLIVFLFLCWRRCLQTNGSGGIF